MLIFTKCLYSQNYLVILQSTLSQCYFVIWKKRFFKIRSLTYDEYLLKIKNFCKIYFITIGLDRALLLKPDFLNLINT